MLRHAVGLSGGLSYHFKALRHANTRWEPFRACVRDFLEKKWAPSQRELVIVGPSAGWTLPLDWLARFDHVVAVEPDPIAALLLTLRFPRGSTTLEIDSSPERLPWFNADRARALPALLEAHPRAAILFANVMGQIPLLVGEKFEDDASCRRLFLEALEGREWASYHDVLSTGAAFRNPFPVATPALELESIAHHYFLGDLQGDAAVVDHETLWLSENRNTSFAPWAFEPGRNHLIAFVSPKKP
ncbi:MAG: hypothetical protein V4760_02680 [Bdellovibrionota bacterium]